ncbi:cadherin-like protein 26 [Halichoeres trimaculatus]|uniref:cadherin-like protein 26 n=1 Tax=Halichoeres trimaculatus TaxID=147232 RepID=UPI003D9EBC08
METLQLSLFMLLCLGIHWSSSELLKRQKRNWIIDSFEIDERYKGPFPYELGTVKIQKNLIVYNLMGQGVDEEPKGTLSIDRNTGMLYVHKAVDFESYRVLKCKFQAMNEVNQTVDTQLGIEIKIKDTNDNAPQFVQSVYEVDIPESTEQGQTVTTIKAVDVDYGKNGEFEYKMVSFAPKHDDVEFYLGQLDASHTGIISFKGCLEHRTAQKYIILVEAKDRGKDVQLSSTGTVIVNVMDGNNHLPVITGLDGPASVREGEENVVVTRVQVKDEDTYGSPAWRAVYKIHGDSNNNFKITTDPETNKGLLTVAKHLNYEDSSTMNLTISVENEAQFYQCKVKTRTSSGLWDVVINGKEKSSPPFGVTVVVEDVNEAPIFLKSNKQVRVKENKPAGFYLETFTAEDHDGVTGNVIQYRKDNDPADFVTVDSKTGKVTTYKPLDRESSLVKNNTYIVKILAVDNGTPPLTGTGTLTIGILDENDNAPLLTAGMLDICQSDNPSKAGINAFDLDEGIHNGPFSFQLLGDVMGKWRVEPSNGFSTNLVKESSVYSGHYELQLEVSDFQQKSVVHNLSVTVCECSNAEQPNCRMRKSTGAAAGGTFVGIIFVALLLVAGLLLLALLVSCKNKKGMMVEEEGLGQQLMNCNTETPGTDCKVASKRNRKSQNGLKIMKESQVKTKASAQVTRTASTSQSQTAQAQMVQAQKAQAQKAQAQKAQAQNDKLQHQTYYLERAMGASSSLRTKQHSKTSMHRSSGRQRKYSAEQNNVAIMNGILPKVLNTKLDTLQLRGKELGDYAPHVYAEEENTEPNYALDAISIPDIPFNSDSVLELDSRFSALASACMPSKDPAQTNL